jgi:hypothetical protein
MRHAPSSTAGVILSLRMQDNPARFDLQPQRHLENGILRFLRAASRCPPLLPDCIPLAPSGLWCEKSSKSKSEAKLLDDAGKKTVLRGRRRHCHVHGRFPRPLA